MQNQDLLSRKRPWLRPKVWKPSSSTISTTICCRKFHLLQPLRASPNTPWLTPKTVKNSCRKSLPFWPVTKICIPKLCSFWIRTKGDSFSTTNGYPPLLAMQQTAFPPLAWKGNSPRTCALAFPQATRLVSASGSPWSSCPRGPEGAMCSLKSSTTPQRSNYWKHGSIYISPTSVPGGERLLGTWPMLSTSHNPTRVGLICPARKGTRKSLNCSVRTTHPLWSRLCSRCPLRRKESRRRCHCLMFLTWMLHKLRIMELHMWRSIYKILVVKEQPSSFMICWFLRTTQENKQLKGRKK